jgi:hypothetical protein
MMTIQNTVQLHITGRGGCKIHKGIKWRNVEIKALMKA